MLRLAAVATAIAAIALFSSVALAQSPEPTLPVAGPDEIIFVGEVPAPPGTEVTVQYLGSDGIVVCGTTRAAEDSAFVLVVETQCAEGVGPLICWAPGLDSCDGVVFSPRPGGDRPEGGDTFDFGLLAVSEPRPPGSPPHGDGVADIALPETGTGLAFGDEGSTFRWQLWIGAVMLAAASMTAGLAYLIRVKRLR